MNWGCNSVSFDLYLCLSLSLCHTLRVKVSCTDTTTLHLKLDATSVMCSSPPSNLKRPVPFHGATQLDAKRS